VAASYHTAGKRVGKYALEVNITVTRIALINYDLCDRGEWSTLKYGYTIMWALKWPQLKLRPYESDHYKRNWTSFKIHIQ